MCEPTTSMLAISSVAAGLSYVEGQQAAKGNAKFQNKKLEGAYQEANDKQVQVNDQSAIDKSERIKQGMLERAKVATIMGETGALGLSSDRLIIDSYMSEGTDIATMEKKRFNTVNSLSSQATEAQIQADGSITAGYNAAPSLIATGLQIGTDVYTGKSKAKEKAKAATTANL